MSNEIKRCETCLKDKLVKSLCDFSYDMVTTTEKTLSDIGKISLNTTSKEDADTRNILYNLIKDNGCSLTRAEFDNNIAIKVSK